MRFTKIIHFLFYWTSVLLLCSCSKSKNSNPTVDIKTGLVAYFPFNGDAKDSSGNGNDGTVLGAALTTDRFGNPNSAYEFFGENFGNVKTRIFTENSASLNILGDLTLSAWVNSKGFGINVGGFYQTIIARRDPSIDTYEMGLYLDDPLNSSFSIIGGRIYSGGSQESITSILIGDFNKWHHLTYTIKSNQVSFYMDGILIQLRDKTSYNLVALNCNCGVVIGSTIEGLQHFAGDLDEVRIYNRALNQSEISYLASH